MDPSKTSSGTAPQPAPMSKAERERQAELRNLENNPKHVAGKKK